VGSRPFGYSIFILNTKIVERPETFETSDCRCDATKPLGGKNRFCNDNCAESKRGQYCDWGATCKDQTDDTLCFNTIAKYTAEYPLPLIFNGTDQFVGKIFYKIVEYHV
jgi:hypothetical protein